MKIAASVDLWGGDTLLLGLLVLMAVKGWWRTFPGFGVLIAVELLRRVSYQLVESPSTGQAGFRIYFWSYYIMDAAQLAALCLCMIEVARARKWLSR